MPHFVSIQGKHAYIRPSLLLFHPNDAAAPGDENVYLHNFLLFTFSGDVAFVLVLAGQQFGFEEVLFTAREYVERAIFAFHGVDEPGDEDVEEWVGLAGEVSRGDEGELEVRRTRELVGLLIVLIHEQLI